MSKPVPAWELPEQATLKAAFGRIPVAEDEEDAIAVKRLWLMLSAETKKRRPAVAFVALRRYVTLVLYEMWQRMSADGLSSWVTRSPGEFSAKSFKLFGPVEYEAKLRQLCVDYRWEGNSQRLLLLPSELDEMADVMMGWTKQFYYEGLLAPHLLSRGGLPLPLAGVESKIGWLMSSVLAQAIPPRSKLDTWVIPDFWVPSQLGKMYYAAANRSIPDVLPVCGECQHYGVSRCRVDNTERSKAHTCSLWEERS